MNVIVFDLEWNQAPPYQTRYEELKEKLPFEVIDVGAVRFNGALERTGVFSERIRPQHYRRINRYIAKVTGMTDADLRRGKPFAEVAAAFQAFCGEDAVFLSWSPSDPLVWLQNRRFFLGDERPMQAIDLQMFFQTKLEPENLGQQRSLESTLEFLELAKPDVFHSALMDAEGAAAVLTELKRRARVDDLLGYGVEVSAVDRINRPFEGVVSEMKLGPVLAALPSVCPLCGEPLAVLPVQKSTPFQAKRAVACKRHGVIRETLSRPTKKEAVRHGFKFMHIGAAFLAHKGPS